VTRSLFLISQSHNEILLRVGLELATSKIAHKIFQWTDGEWYSDESRREWFRDVVQTNLAKVLDTCSGERPDDETLAAANLTVKEVQAELLQAVERCQAAEILVEKTQSQVQNLERALGDKSDRILLSQKQLDEAEVKLKTAHQKLGESRKAAAALEAQLRDANAECLGLESDLRHRRAQSPGSQIAAVSKEKEKDSATQVNAAILRSRTQSAETAHSKVLAELQQNATALETWVGTAEAAKSQTVELMSSVSQLEEQLAALQAEAAGSGSAEKTAELEEALLDLNNKFTCLAQDNSRLRIQLDTALEAPCLSQAPEGKAIVQSSPCESSVQKETGGPCLPVEAEKKPRAAAAVSSSVPSSKRVAEVTCDVQADAKLAASLENTRRSLKKLAAENKELKASLDGLNSNLKAVMNSCQDSGASVRMAKIIDNFELKRELKGAGVFPVWDRLYSDAMGRVDRLERCRAECVTSPHRASSKRSPTAQSEEMKWQSQTFSTFPHVAPDLLESHDSLCTSASVSPTKASFGDFAGLSQTISGGCWSLPPCSASRQARCASAHRLRAARQASRGGRLLLSSCVVSPHGEEQGPASRSSTASPPCRRPKTSLSLPSLHGHRHPSYQNN